VTRRLPSIEINRKRRGVAKFASKFGEALDRLSLNVAEIRWPATVSAKVTRLTMPLHIVG
jgi:hypothetical protein